MNDFWNWWQNMPENINPVFIEIGPFEVRYYSLMYVIAFMVVYFLSLWRIRTEKFHYKTDFLEEFFLWCFISLIIFARLGYILFYNFRSFLDDPEIIFGFQDGQFYGISGMSYHGGIIGLLLVGYIYKNKKGINLWKLADFLIPAIPLGYTFGRIGNFINGELFGRITNVKWWMYFPLDHTNQLRHPSQLYEAIGEGVLIFILLWGLRKHIGFNKTLPDSKSTNHKFYDRFKKYFQFEGALFAIYLIIYGIIRFIIEYFREPDAHLGFVLFDFSMGQVLCFIMIILGLSLFIYKNLIKNHEKKKEKK